MLVVGIGPTTFGFEDHRSTIELYEQINLLTRQLLIGSLFLFHRSGNYASDYKKKTTSHTSEDLIVI